MKYLFLILFSISLVVVAQSQKLSTDQLPKAVQNGFAMAYPDGQAKKWELIDGKYWVTVKTDYNLERAMFTINGEWVETQYEVGKDEVPPRVFEFIDERYNGYKIGQLSYVEENKGGSFYFTTVFLKTNKEQRTELVFDLVGEIVKIDNVHVTNKDGQIESDAENIAKSNNDDKRRTSIETSNIEISEATLKALRKKFPQYTNLRWTMNSEGHYIAMFDYREETYEADFDENEELVSTTTFFTKKTIPLFAIENTLAKDYSKAKFIEGRKITFESRYARKYPDKKAKNYFSVKLSEKVKGSKNPKLSTLIFDTSGQLDMVIDNSENL